MNYSYNPVTATLHVSVDGNLVSTNTAPIGEMLCTAMEKSTELKLLEWDLSRAAMIDSAGLNLLISLVRAVGARGGKVRVHVGNTNVHRIMIFTRLDRHLEIVKTGDIASNKPAA